MRGTAGREHPIEDWIARRRSPRSFEPLEPSAAELRSMLEAARWAASCFNDQPWHFLVARRSEPDAFRALLECLTPGNQSWAAGAGALLLSVARDAFSHNGRANAHAWHDCGLALAQLSLQAGALGWFVHPMAGFDAERAREVAAIPSGFSPVAAAALGRPADPARLPAEQAERERAPRLRRPQRDFVFGARWGRELALDEEAEWEPVLQFWFGPLTAQGVAEPAQSDRWWRADPAFDAEIRERFAPLHAELAGGEHGNWSASPRGRLAAIIVLDQFSRNLHRGTAPMYAQDAAALELALQGIARGADQALLPDERSFYYLPLMHAESAELQQRCVELFERLRAEVDEPLQPRFARQLEFATRHRDIIARWGRFPHRNAALGRESSAEELAFLKLPGSSF